MKGYDNRLVSECLQLRPLSRFGEIDSLVLKIGQSLDEAVMLNAEVQLVKM